MKAIIVDDEPKAIALLESYIKLFSAIELVDSFRNGLKAIEYISKNKIDLVFLDINMPHISGISLSKMIAPKTRIIFTTAYSEYAVESYEVQAVDYLLKPISLERFSKTISKIIAATDKPLQVPEDIVILIKSGSRVHRVKVNDILYLEKDGNYITYHVKEGRILARESVSQSLSQLPSYFIQTHKSYVINCREVNSVERENVSIGGETIPIGASFKDKVMQNLLNPE